MGLISEKDKEHIRKMFADMPEEMTLLLFIQENKNDECPYCESTREIAEELSGLSDKINLKVLDFHKDKAEAERFNVNKVPALVFLGKNETDYGMRFYGIPSGYEFTTLIEDIIDVSKGTSKLSSQTKQLLAQINKDIHIQVFVTPT